MGTLSRSPLQIQSYYRPGNSLDDSALEGLINSIQIIAADCFDVLPPYQVMKGTRQALSDKLISLARDDVGIPAGFCSMVFLPVRGVGEVLHLGLTCVRPRFRGRHLTHLLVKKALTRYLFRHNPFGKIWISNCAAVMSSLGNVAMHFERVYPSPFHAGKPGAVHVAIARAIDDHFRDKMYVLPDAVFDPERFVFQGSVKNTVFHKKKIETASHHRKQYLNRFYGRLMDFDQGDEVLQVGYFHLTSVINYYLRQVRMKKMLHVDNPALETF